MCTVDSTPLLQTVYESSVDTIQRELVDPMLAIPATCCSDEELRRRESDEDPLFANDGAAEFNALQSRIKLAPYIAGRLLVLLLNGAFPAPRS